MPLDPRLILAGSQSQRPLQSLLQGAQVGQQLVGEQQRQTILGQQADQQLTTGELKQQLIQRQLDALGVPDVPTAKELAFNAAKLSALPTTEAKLKEIDRLKSVAKDANRTTDNLDSLQEAYSISDEEGDQLLNAGILAFERIGFLTPEEKAKAATFQKAEGGMVFDPNTGKYSLDPVAVDRLAELENKQLTGNLDFKDRQSLNKDITSMISGSVDIHKTAKDLEKLGEIGGGPSAIAMVFKFMKALDPQSVVREGEFALAEQAAGVDERILNVYNKLVDGERLGPEQIKSFVNTAKLLSNTALEGSNTEVNKYLDTFEETISPSFAGKIKKRLPEKFKLENGKSLTDRQERLQELRSRVNL